MAYIQDLRAFVEVADQGRFTQAAAHLFISQPTLSRRVGRLAPAARQRSLPAEALDDFLGNAAARVLKLVG